LRVCSRSWRRRPNVQFCADNAAHAGTLPRRHDNRTAAGSCRTTEPKRGGRTPKAAAAARTGGGSGSRIVSDEGPARGVRDPGWRAFRAGGAPTPASRVTLLPGVIRRRGRLLVAYGGSSSPRATRFQSAFLPAAERRRLRGAMGRAWRRWPWPVVELEFGAARPRPCGLARPPPRRFPSSFLRRDVRGVREGLTKRVREVVPQAARPSSRRGYSERPARERGEDQRSCSSRGRRAVDEQKVAQLAAVGRARRRQGVSPKQAAEVVARLSGVAPTDLPAALCKQNGQQPDTVLACSASFSTI